MSEHYNDGTGDLRRTDFRFNGTDLDGMSDLGPSIAGLPDCQI